jgi:hypothetical protein
MEGRTDGPAIFMEFWPHALKTMGTDPGELLNMLQSRHYQFYDFHSNRHIGLTRAEPADVMAMNPVGEGQAQTDLLLLRGGRELPSRTGLGSGARDRWWLAIPLGAGAGLLFCGLVYWRLRRIRRAGSGV